MGRRSPSTTTDDVGRHQARQWPRRADADILLSSPPATSGSEGLLKEDSSSFPEALLAVVCVGCCCSGFGF